MGGPSFSSTPSGVGVRDELFQEKDSCLRWVGGGGESVLDRGDDGASFRVVALVTGGGGVGFQETGEPLTGVCDGMGGSVVGEALLAHEVVVFAVESQEKEASLYPHANLEATGVCVRVGGIKSAVLETDGGASQEKEELLG